MGGSILRFYSNHVKKSWKIAFFSAFFVGLLVHMFRFTNVLPNHDALFNVYSTQNMVGSGRWFLAIACGFSGLFDLPWMIGTLSLLFISLTSAVISEVFEIDNPILIVLVSGLLVSFPAITDTMFFEFTADGYMLAMLLASLSVLFSKMNQNGCVIYKLFLSALCLCLSCAIYQAYISFALVLAICYFITELLDNRYKTKDYLLWIASQAVTYVVGLFLYFVIWKLCMKLQGYVPTTYGGINDLGLVGFDDLKGAIYDTFWSFVFFFFEWDIFEHGLTLYSLLNICFVIALILGVVWASIKAGLFRRKVELLLVGVCLVAIPFTCYIWYFTSRSITYAARMLQSICILYIFTGVIYDRWIKLKISDLVALLITTIIFNNCITANAFYNYMNQCYERSYATSVELMTRIHMHDDGSVKYIAIIGSLDGFTNEAKMDPSQLRSLGVLKTVNYTLAKNELYLPLFLTNYTDFSLSYYKIAGIEPPLIEPGLEYPVSDEWEFRFPQVSNARMEELESSVQVMEMDVWPAEDSVKVIGDTIVVKLSEPIAD